MADWCEEHFQAIGLDDVRQEPVPVPHWQSEHATLTAWPEGRPDEVITLPRPGPPPHRAGRRPGGAGRALQRGRRRHRGHRRRDGGAERAPQSLLRAWPRPSTTPTTTSPTSCRSSRSGPASRRWPSRRWPAGAVGWVGVLDAPWDTCDYYVPYDGIARAISGLWLSRSSGAELDRLLDAGPVTGRLAVDARREEVAAHNVDRHPPGRLRRVGRSSPPTTTLPGRPRSRTAAASPWCWPRSPTGPTVPAEERPHNLLFLLTTGHMVHGAGTRGFIDAHPTCSTTSSWRST